MILADAFRPEFLARFDIKAPVRIPKSFHTDPDRSRTISRASKCRSSCRTCWITRARSIAAPTTSSRLIAEGEGGDPLLEERAADVAASPLGHGQTAGQAAA